MIPNTTDAVLKGMLDCFLVSDTSLNKHRLRTDVAYLSSGGTKGMEKADGTGIINNNAVSWGRHNGHSRLQSGIQKLKLHSSSTLHTTQRLLLRPLQRIAVTT